MKGQAQMFNPNNEYVGCTILIYDDMGNDMGKTTVTAYDKNTMWIRVKKMPPALDINHVCRVLMLTSPAPREYQGRIIAHGTGKAIAVFKGKEKESRKAARYKVDFTALIENLIYDEKAYPLHTPLVVNLINISKNGVRFRAPFYSLYDGISFQMRMKIDKSEKLLIAIVLNHRDKNADDISEYGCRFLVGSEEEV
jgi:hypothetical protein